MKINVARIINYASIVFSACLVLFSVSMAYALLVPVDVLKDWKISTDKSSYSVGERAIASVSYEKVRKARSHTYYYLDCERSTGGTLRYPISQADSNRPPGKTTTELPFTIPPNVSNLPAECRLVISATYDVYRFRNFVEEIKSNRFSVVNEEIR